MRVVDAQRNDYKIIKIEVKHCKYVRYYDVETIINLALAVERSCH